MGSCRKTGKAYWLGSTPSGKLSGKKFPLKSSVESEVAVGTVAVKPGKKIKLD